MEAVFFKFHERLCTCLVRHTSHKTRSLVENSIVILAMGSFGLVALMHKNFVYRGSNATNTQLQHQHCNGGNNNQFSYTRIPEGCLRSIPGWSEDVDVTHLIINDKIGVDNRTIFGSRDGSIAWIPDQILSTNEGSIDSNLCAGNLFHKNKEICKFSVETRTKATSHSQTKEDFKFYKSKDIMFSYSQLQGFLLLPDEAKQLHNVSTQFVIVSRYDMKCFGDPALQTLTYYITGSTSVVTNWFLALHNGDGFMYNPRNQQLKDLHDYSTPLNALSSSSFSKESHFRPKHKVFLYKISILFTSVFIFFMTTTLASFILLETQDRMLKFTVQLQNHVQNRLPLWRLVCSHIIESLVFIPIMLGVLVFLMDFIFFGNAVIGFGVLSMVWLGEVFAVICTRTRASTHFFPRVFFLYFTLFLIYFFVVPFGFTTTALTTTFLLLLHSMVFFFNRYELPAYELGYINADTPRIMTSRITEDWFEWNTGDESIINSGNHIHDRRSSSQTMSTSGSRLRFANSETQNLSATDLQSYPSNNLLFFEGDDDDDDDDDSYAVFMNGEVVVHRNRVALNSVNRHTSAPSSSTRGSSVRSALPRPTSSSSVSLRGYRGLGGSQHTRYGYVRDEVALSSSSLRSLLGENGSSASSPNVVNRRATTTSTTITNNGREDISPSLPSLSGGFFLS